MTFLPTAPTLDVDIQPSSAIVLDTAPYNTIILTCIATASEGVIIAKSFAWKEGPLDSQTIIMDNGDTVLISIDNVESPESTSTLTVMEKSVGQYMYTCSVKMNIPEGLEITSSFTANVTVQGMLCMCMSYSLVIPIALFPGFRFSRLNIPQASDFPD